MIKLEEFESVNKLDTVLIIDGKTITTATSNENIKKKFFSVATKAPAVICCRCSPKQKAMLTTSIK